jgi:hypothetical protein
MFYHLALLTTTTRGPFDQGTKKAFKNEMAPAPHEKHEKRKKQD